MLNKISVVTQCEFFSQVPLPSNKSFCILFFPLASHTFSFVVINYLNAFLILYLIEVNQVFAFSLISFILITSLKRNISVKIPHNRFTLLEPNMSVSFLV